MRTWSRFFIRTSGSMAARSEGWYIGCMGAILEGAQGPRRPGPVDVVAGPGDGAAAPDVGRAEDEDPVGLGRLPGLVAPRLRHRARGRHDDEGDARGAVDRGPGSAFPEASGQPVAPPDPAA